MPGLNLQESIRVAIDDNNSIRLNGIICDYIDSIEPHLPLILDYILDPGIGPWDYNLDNSLIILKKFPEKVDLLHMVCKWIVRGDLLITDNNRNGNSEVFLRYLLRSYENWNPAYSYLWEVFEKNIVSQLGDDDQVQISKGFLWYCDLASAVDSSLVGEAKEIGHQLGEKCHNLTKRNQTYGEASQINIKRIRKRCNIYDEAAIEFSHDEALAEIDLRNKAFDHALDTVENALA